MAHRLFYMVNTNMERIHMEDIHMVHERLQYIVLYQLDIYKHNQIVEHLKTNEIFDLIDPLPFQKHHLHQISILSQYLPKVCEPSYQYMVFSQEAVIDDRRIE